MESPAPPDRTDARRKSRARALLDLTGEGMQGSEGPASGEEGVHDLPVTEEGQRSTAR